MNPCPNNVLTPYPAMVADELALDLVRRHLPKNATVLDPFCGSGRLLAAAEQASLRVGIDTNPLAWLLTTAKLADASATVVADLVADIGRAQRAAAGVAFGAFERRQVDWFAPATLLELQRIVGWLNAYGLPKPERYLVASALSATVREVSYARQSGWKLHRLRPDERAARSTCPWQRLERRLRYCIAELRRGAEMVGERHVVLGSVDALTTAEHPARSRGPYDAVITSPPYGDSRTTVQYGAASALCLSVVGRVEGLDHLAAPGNEIDANCLGGRRPAEPRQVDIGRYWAGVEAGKLARGVERFLSDYDQACEAIAQNVKPGGTAVLVVGRRSTGGAHVKLDDFTIDCFSRRGFNLAARETRVLQYKRVPRKINRFGRSKSVDARGRGTVTTMDREIILILRKAKAAPLN